MKKKILCMMLVVAMVLPVINISVFAVKPGVSTVDAVEIGSDRATLRGMVTSNSGIRIKEYGFQYGRTNDILSYKKYYAGKDFDYPDPINNDIIEFTLKNLDADTDYHFEFYAINENGEKNIGRSFYFSTEGCSHDYTDEEYQRTDFEQIRGDDTYHNETVYNIELCEDCGEVIRRDIKYETKKTKHNFTGDICKECEYERNCTHRYYDDYYDHTNYEQISGDNTSHWAIHYFERQCDDCGEAIETNIAGNREKREHNYSGNTCSDCKYTKEEVYEAPPAQPVNPAPEISEPVQEEDTQSPVIVYFDCEPSGTVNRDEVRKIEYEAEASDNVGIKSIKAVYSGTPINSGNGTYISGALSTKDLSLGRYEFYIIAEDTSGNETYSDPIYLNIIENEESFSPTPQQNQGSTQPDGSWQDISEILHNEAYSNASWYGGIKVYVDGTKVNFDVQPELKNDRTMVPLRAIFEALGATVMWDDETSTVTAYRAGEKVELTIGSYYLYTSSGSKRLDQPAYVVNDRTLVPVRAISEAFDCDVEWFEDKQLVSVVS